MKKGRVIIGKGSVLIALVLGIGACSKKTSVPVKELSSTAQKVTGDFQNVQASSRSMYCSQIRSLRKQQQKSE
jgi:uncharacterized protein YoxC